MTFFSLQIYPFVLPRAHRANPRTLSTMTSANLDEKRLPSEDEHENAKAEHEFHNNVGGYGAMPDDPDAGLSAKERAAIVCRTI